MIDARGCINIARLPRTFEFGAAAPASPVAATSRYSQLHELAHRSRCAKEDGKMAMESVVYKLSDEGFHMSDVKVPNPIAGLGIPASHVSDLSF